MSNLFGKMPKVYYLFIFKVYLKFTNFPEPLSWYLNLYQIEKYRQNIASICNLQP